MLESIKITNLAIISKSSIQFGEGFNVLTGETGAGKSLVVDALLFLTGIRADKTLIKSGEEFARVEGVFSVDNNNPILSEILSSVDIENEGTIIISRYFSLSGKNECRINGEIVTLNILRKVASCLLDIFGQNDSQLLLDSHNHLTLLDEIISDKLSDSKARLSIQLDKLHSINREISELGGLDKDRENTLKLLQFEIDEINGAGLELGLEEELKSKLNLMQNSEKVYEALNGSIDVLDGEYNIPNMLKTAINTLSQVDRFDDSITKEKDRLYSLKYELEDIISTLNSNLNNLSYSQEELDLIQDKLSDIKDLERKYGNTIADIFEYRDRAQSRLDLLLTADERLEILRQDKGRVLSDIYLIAVDLREIRKREFVSFSEALVSELKKLGMKNAKFELSFENDINVDTIESEITSEGADRVEFLFSANLGVEPRSLSKIISGGEMSRFMLAFKSLQSGKESKTCIFDEIDAGIGGEIGGVVGQKICEISRTNQVICITHLAQIAVFGDHNFKIEKFEDEGTTHTSVTLISTENKVGEIARMLGDSTNSSALSHASEIIAKANDYKIRL